MIHVAKLSHRYAESSPLALDEVNLSVAEGALFGLLGPNGAGKTTLISLLTGLLSLQEGEATVGGYSLCDSLSAIQEFCSLVPQEYAFYPMLSARENLEFFGGVRGLGGELLAERIARCVEIAALGAVVDRQARHYSGGLKRRLNLAIGLLNRPRLLFLDEPTVGIDPQSRAFILEAIRELNREGATVVYTSHYMEEVQQLCDEIAIIDGGKILVQGRLDALLASSSSRRLVVDLEHSLDSGAQARLAQQRTCRFEGRRITIELEGGADGVAEVFLALREVRAQVLRAQLGAKDLDELFLALTAHSLRD